MAELMPTPQGRRHPGNGDRRRLRTVVDRGGERRSQQFRLRFARQLAAQHQPDHRREADFSDQLLDRIATQPDHARPHLYDAGRPPFLAARATFPVPAHGIVSS
jgi:hypothetical protein